MLGGGSYPRSMNHHDFKEKLNVLDSIQMIAIPGGEFEMGSPEEVGNKFEHPQHVVKIAPFYLSRTPITQVQWISVMGRNPSYFREDHLPVECVSWHDAQEFCKALSERSDKKFRLPSEAEWEYACRAGTRSEYCVGDTINFSLANFGRNVGQTSTVGLYAANDFGLRDMVGNVWEWCEDSWHEDYEGCPSDGSAWIDKDGPRILRGCSWLSLPSYCRSAYRLRYSPGVRSNDFGFRLALSLRTSI